MPNNQDSTFTFPNGQVIKCKSLSIEDCEHLGLQGREWSSDDVIIDEGLNIPPSVLATPIDDTGAIYFTSAEPRLTFEEQYQARRLQTNRQLANVAGGTRILPKRPAKRRRRLKLLIMRIYHSERINGAIEFVMMAGFFALWVAAILVLAASVGT